MDLDKYKNLPSDTLQTLLDNGIIEGEDAKAIKLIMANRELAVLRRDVKKVHEGTIHPPTEAMPRYWTYVDDPTRKNHRRRIAKTSERDLYIALLNFYVPGAEYRYKTITLETLYPEWIKYKELHTTASSTLVRLNSTWRRFYASSDIVKIDIQKLTKLMLDEWIHGVIREFDLNKKGFENVATILRQALDYAVDRNMILSNPYNQVHVDTRRVCRKTLKPDPETQVFTSEEKRAMIEHAWNDFQSNKKLRLPLASLAVAFQLNCGLRVSELCALKFSDVDREGVLHVRRFVRGQYELVDGSKTAAGVREVPLPPEALKVIDCCREWQKKEYGKAGPFLFSGATHLKTRIIDDRYVTFCKALNIRKRSSHKARKTYISQLVDHNVGIDTVCRVAGHASSAVTFQNYVFDRNTKEARKNQIIDALLDEES